MSVTEYIWNPLTDSVLEERDGSVTVQPIYTTKPQARGPLVSQTRGTTHYHFDANGNTRLLSNFSSRLTGRCWLPRAMMVRFESGEL